MVDLRVVLYAEGPGELGGLARRLPAPGDALGEEHLGAGHILIRRLLVSLDATPRFEAPQRVRARHAKGSDLLHGATKPRAAKAWLAGQLHGRDEGSLRTEIARACDLDVVSKRCRSFARLRNALHEALGTR